MEAAGRARATIARRLCSIAGFYRYAVEEELPCMAVAMATWVSASRVTARAVAERAGLPHGAVSYHFRGKQELLVEATMFAFQRAAPVEDFAARTTAADLIGLIAAELGDHDGIGPVTSWLWSEAMREANATPRCANEWAACSASTAS